MALSNKERQARYREKVTYGELVRLDMKLPLEVARKLHYLATHWQCSKVEAMSRLLMDTWEREGNPVYDKNGTLLSGDD